MVQLEQILTMFCIKILYLRLLIYMSYIIKYTNTKIYMQQVPGTVSDKIEFSIIGDKSGNLLLFYYLKVKELYIGVSKREGVLRANRR